LFYAQYILGAFALLSFDGTTASQVWTSPYGVQKELACLNNVLFFQGYAMVSGLIERELWKSGGTSATTSIYADIYPGVSSGTTGNASTPSNFTLFNNKLYFTATNATYGAELWVTDGLSAPTAIDINSNSASSSPSYLRIYNNQLYFKANNGSNGGDLMSYDGTTLTPRDLVAGTGSPFMDTNVVVAQGFFGGHWLRTLFDKWYGTRYRCFRGPNARSEWNDNRQLNGCRRCADV
jgi:ELWxxDGT repeat protein